MAGDLRAEGANIVMESVGELTRQPFPQLAGLHQRGIPCDEEFAAKKPKLLDRV
jgi:hypothetical protein